jgi:copper chaperone
MTMTSSTYQVTGLTCGHCVQAVRGELSALDGVSDVAIDLDPAGVSVVTVTSAQPLRPDQVSAALDEAGDYRLVPAP